MSVTVTQTLARVKDAIKGRVPKERLADYLDADFYIWINQVQRDMNSFGEYLIDRYYKKTGSDNATTTDTTNYVNYDLSYNVMRVIRFMYESTTYEDQYYSYTGNRLVLKVPVSASSAYQMDFLYVRDTADVSSGASTIDVPDQLIPIFDELLKAKALANMDPELPFDLYLEIFKRHRRDIISMSPDNHNLYKSQDLGSRRYNMQMSGGDDIYDITHKFTSIGNFTADGNGDYLHDDES